MDATIQTMIDIISALETNSDALANTNEALAKIVSEINFKEIKIFLTELKEVNIFLASMHVEIGKIRMKCAKSAALLVVNTNALGKEVIDDFQNTIAEINTRISEIYIKLEMFHASEMQVKDEIKTMYAELVTFSLILDKKVSSIFSEAENKINEMGNKIKEKTISIYDIITSDIKAKEFYVKNDVQKVFPIMKGIIGELGLKHLHDFLKNEGQHPVGEFEVVVENEDKDNNPASIETPN